MKRIVYNALQDCLDVLIGALAALGTLEFLGKTGIGPF